MAWRRLLLGAPVAALLALLATWRRGGRDDFLTWVNKHYDVAPFAGLPFTPTLLCEPSVSALLDRFDWHLVQKSPYTIETGCGNLVRAPWADVKRVADPKTVWATPNALDRLLEMAEGSLDPTREGRVVLFSGTEAPLSTAFGRTPAERNLTLARLRRYFSRIVYQTKDVPMEHVALAPMGMSWGYMLFLFGFWRYNTTGKETLGQKFAAFGDGLRVGLGAKDRGALAPQGKVGGAWLDHPRTSVEPLPLLDHYGMLFPPSNSSLRAVEAAFQSRAQLRGFAATPAALAAGVEQRYIHSNDWWRELARYRFLLSPLGSNIQTAKNVEALMVLTVPVVQRRGGFSTYDELVSMGFPLVLVDEWPEVSRASTAAWWRELSPRLESFRRNCLSAEGYWRMYIGSTTRCE